MALPILDGNQSATTLSTILTGGAHIPAHTVVSLGTQAISDIGSAVSGISVSIAGTQSVTGSVSVLNFPASQSTTFGAVTGSISVLNFPSTQTIAGTVTANGGDFASKNTTQPASAIQLGFQNIGGDFTAVNQDGASFPIRLNELEANIVVPISGTVTVGNSVTIGSLPAISGTVTANNSVLSNVLDYDGNNYFLKIGGRTAGGKTDYPINVSGTVTIGSLPSGALTTRFGSVTTANTAQITSAVTNTSRKYLLAQNISAGTVTIGIGFSPTTTQGIQLTAGAGLTFDAFCPTGAVYWLGAVTGAAFTILEG